MTYIQQRKKEAEEYRKWELADWELKSSIRMVREEFSLKDMANAIKKVLKPEEVKSLAKELKS